MSRKFLVLGGGGYFGFGGGGVPILFLWARGFFCKIPWPFFSRKPPGLTSINPEITSSNVC